METPALTPGDSVDLTVLFSDSQVLQREPLLRHFLDSITTASVAASVEKLVKLGSSITENAMEGIQDVSVQRFFQHSKQYIWR
jgi:hypothetical protein